MINHFNIEDPWLTNIKTIFKKSCLRNSKEGMNIKDKNYLKVIRDIFDVATEKQFSGIKK